MPEVRTTNKREVKAVARLKLHPRNPRKIEPAAFEALKNSLKKFGCYRPPVWNRRFRHIVAGNQTVRALKDLGVKKVEVTVVDLDEKDDLALLVNDNNRFAQGQYTTDVHDLVGHPAGNVHKAVDPLGHVEGILPVPEPVDPLEHLVDRHRGGAPMRVAIGHPERAHDIRGSCRHF